MSTIIFKPYAFAYTGEMEQESQFAGRPFKHYDLRCFESITCKLMPSIPPGAFTYVTVNISENEQARYSPKSIVEAEFDLEHRLHFMLTNPTASLRFCPETGFSFDDPDETIFRLSR